jgi:hypothetical protein
VTVGCARSMNGGPMPTRPSALTILAGDGLVCYPDSDHEALMVYVMELERQSAIIRQTNQQ